MLENIGLLILSYLLGSIPFGYIIAKFKGIDIQAVGSGNIGATNVARTLGMAAGVIVFILDLLKGTAAVLITGYFLQNTGIDPAWWMILSGGAAFLGHTFPIFLKFKGGRGSAVGLGILLGITPNIFIGAMIMTLLIVALTRYVSLASILIPPMICVAMIAMDKPFPYILITVLATILLIIKHIPNIKRLLNGTERKAGQKIDV